MAAQPNWRRAVQRRLRAVLTRSLLYRLARRATATAPTPGDGETGGLWEGLRCSWLARWLTAEPDPDVIVIDLREVRTVRPFVLALESVLDGLATATVYSRTGAVAYRALDRLARAPVRSAGSVLLLATGAGGLGTITGDGPSTATLGVLGASALVGLLALAETRSWRELRETRPVGWLASAFSPPEPPERNSER